MRPFGFTKTLQSTTCILTVLLIFQHVDCFTFDHHSVDTFQPGQVESILGTSSVSDTPLSSSGHLSTAQLVSSVKKDTLAPALDRRQVLDSTSRSTAIASDAIPATAGWTPLPTTLPQNYSNLSMRMFPYTPITGVNNSLYLTPNITPR